MSLTEWAVDLAVLGVPPLSCAWAWWLWARHRRTGNVSILRWRRVTTIIALIAFTLSIAFGAFALEYWRTFPEHTAAPPTATYITTYIGFALAAFGVPLALMAKSWERVALVLCALGLSGFYFGMFLSP